MQIPQYGDLKSAVQRILFIVNVLLNSLRGRARFGARVLTCDLPMLAKMNESWAGIVASVI